MLENEKERIEVTDSQDTSEDYISAINEMKKNTVSKDSYNKLRDENKRLLQSLVNGEAVQVENLKKPSIDELRKDLFSESQELNNVNFISKALELRSALIEAGETDPFLPVGKRITPTEEDISIANRVATVLQECVDYSEGDSAAFTAELTRRTIDTAPTVRRK